MRAKADQNITFTKPVKYLADGRGRDFYISYNHGGSIKDIQVLKGSNNTNGIINKRFYHIAYVLN